MKKIIYFALFILISFSLFADWDPGDPAKWVQLPDPTGYDVYFTDQVAPHDTLLADDWECTEENFVDSVHIWISFREDNVPIDPTFGIEYVHLSIHSDFPDPDGPGPLYSHPDLLLWEKDIYPPYFTVRYYDTGEQGWYDPYKLPPFNIIEGDHYNFYQINICCGPDAFFQMGTPGEPIVYWLDACVKVKDEYPGVEVGWKSSQDFWNDDAVYWAPPWTPLPDPGLRPPYQEDFSLAFVLNGHDEPCPVDLSSFYGTYINGIPSIYWTTQSETDNSYWNVYRGDSNEFSQAFLINGGDPITGQGTTSHPTDYIYVDEAPVVQNMTYWYWIESISTDGESELHVPTTLFIPFEDTPNTFDMYGLYQNYPNP